MQQLFRIITIAFILGFLTVSSALTYIFIRYSKDLPDYKQLKSYNPLITTRLYSYDGELIKEFSKENRIFVAIDIIPQHLIDAFIAAEDSNFYRHSGIDIAAIIRATINNAVAYMKNERLAGGASTITQQVVKNFLLTNERTLTRKIKEAILAYKITKTFSKDRILELYLNQIYLGSSSYGVAAASQAYFDKSIDELTIEEVALLATLPKAPSKLDPRKNIEKAKIRRDWVINRMLAEGFIDKKDAMVAISTPITLRKYNNNIEAVANSFSDNVKKELTRLYGSDNVFESGIMVRTTLDTKMQKIAKKALQRGLELYDRRHGYRGSITNINLRKNPDWQAKLKEIKIEKLYKDSWEKAIILDYNDDEAEIGLIDQENGIIKKENIVWARKYIDIDTVGNDIKKISDAFKKGDVILVENIIGDLYGLRQIPEVNGAAMAMDPHSGRILAMSGGYIDASNQFNRTNQARRQPGSVLKTFGYLTALENGLTPATIIMDEPVTLDQGDELPPYSPMNYSKKFYGPTTLRKGLEKSINITTVRAVSQVGLDKMAQTIKKFKINDDPEPIYSLVLGSTETTLSKLIMAYSMIVNGGKDITPTVIEKIQDRNGKVIFKRDERDCKFCNINIGKNENDTDIDIKEIIIPELTDNRKQITDEATAYQITSMLEGTVKRGTGRKALAVKKILGGKTGTTNNSFDSWFVGFSPDLVFGVYVGFDIPKSLGKYETGASIALPVFVDFMKEALLETPSTPFRVPDTIKFVKIDKNTGRSPTPSTAKYDIIFEALKLDDKIEDETIFKEENYDGMDSEIENGSEHEAEENIGIY